MIVYRSSQACGARVTTVSEQQPFPMYQRKRKVEHMINFSISLRGYLIIALIDSHGPLLNIKIYKKESWNQKDGIFD